MGPFEKLVSNIEQLQDLGFKSELNIEPFLMPDVEVAKFLIKTQQPTMTDEQVSLMVESPAKLKGKIDKNLSDEEKKKKKEQIDEIHAVLKTKKKEKIKEAKDKKDEIKTAVFNLVREIKDLIKKMIMSIMQAISAIAAIVVIVAAPPWNIPLAISYAMTIVEIILNIIAHIKRIMPYTPPLKNLNLVCDPKKLSKLAAIINVFINIILALWKKTSALEAIISALLGFLIPLLTSGKAKDKALRENGNKLRDLGHFSATNSDGSEKRFNVDGRDIRANDQSAAEQIKQILDDFKVDYGNQTCTDYKDPAMADVMNGTLMNQLKDAIGKSGEDIVKDTGEEFYEVYDVKLPDGRVLTEQTADDLKTLEQVYTLVYEGISDLTEKAKKLAEAEQEGEIDE